jgi:hypothetical protein
MCTLEHWIFSAELSAVLKTMRIPFYIRGIRGSGDGSMDNYEGSAARTVPPTACKSTPQEGEVLVSVIRGVRPVQISIHPRYLVPWTPRQGSNVVVIDGSWLGFQGIVVGNDADSYTVRFTMRDSSGEHSHEEIFDIKQLARLDSLRK